MRRRGISRRKSRIISDRRKRKEKIHRPFPRGDGLVSDSVNSGDSNVNKDGGSAVVRSVGGYVGEGGGFYVGGED